MTKPRKKTSHKPTAGEQLAALLTRLSELHPAVLVALMHVSTTHEDKAAVQALLKKEIIH